jgi:hypothetical protein
MAPLASPQVAMLAVSVTFMVLNPLFIGLRSYTQIKIAKMFKTNDALMVVAVLAYASLFALLTLGLESGIGAHTSTATVKGITAALEYIWFLEIIYVVLTSSMKASIALTLLQWAKSKTHIWLLWGSIVVDVIISAVFTGYVVFQCTPVDYAWKQLDPNAKGKCLPFTGQLYMGFALCITTVCLDMLFLFLPFFMLRGRGVNSRIKSCIYGLFGLGVLASFANFIRLAALVKLKSSADPLFDAAPVFTWSAVEVSIGICVAGIMELGPLMHKYNVKGFEYYATYVVRLEDDEEPLKLQDMDKQYAVEYTRTR